ncbi:MAG: His/Gly/Thr/Pro-type tRNA ligase C-terminal domain-containing protein [Candidatus Syntrophopropionicum ammoniitolerans]
MKGQGIIVGAPAKCDVFVVTAGSEVADTAYKLLFSLRAAGISADKDYLGRSLRAQMKYAGKCGAHFVVIIGAEELARGTAPIRDMNTGKQEDIRLDSIAAYLAAHDIS